MFPNLKERRASRGTRLSGGEQQMLALARILRTGAKLLLLDEISEGLAPVIVQALARTVRRLREQGYTIVMVEQNFRFAAPLADRFYVMEHGRIVEGFAARELQRQNADAAPVPRRLTPKSNARKETTMKLRIWAMATAALLAAAGGARGASAAGEPGGDRRHRRHVGRLRGRDGRSRASRPSRWRSPTSAARCSARRSWC